MLSSLNELVPGGVSRNGVSARQLFLAIRRFLMTIAELDIEQKAIPLDLWTECNQYALIAEAAAVASSEKKHRKLKVTL
ncbi:hypothetical protein GTP27_22865 [Pseudoduganella sp. CY13W]|uniref:Uncharacterized protein n=2 Tax=Duganella qianjiadongensis TaxID=2692176 RepID=A0ABW9VST6_9BURK|nr:hypothetical protein [Duganella qianjiadongensis]